MKISRVARRHRLAGQAQPTSISVKPIGIWTVIRCCVQRQVDGVALEPGADWCGLACRRGRGDFVRSQRDESRRIQPSLDVRLANPPLSHESIGRISAVQRARGLAVDVLRVLVADDAELREVEMRVHRLERIVRPLDQIEPHREGAVALPHLQRAPHPCAAIAVDHARHVRPLRRLSPFDRGQRIDEADQAIGVERADENAAAVHRHGQDRHRHHFVITRAPDLPLERHDLRELVDGRQIAICDCRRHRMSSNSPSD